LFNQKNQKNQLNPACQCDVFVQPQIAQMSTDYFQTMIILIKLIIVQSVKSEKSA